MKEIIMPKLSPTMETGTVVRWLKKEGEFVEAGEIFLEIETDKAVNEVTASDSGSLGKILVDEGESADVLQVLGYILEPGESTPDEWSLQAFPLPVPESGSVVDQAVPQTFLQADRVSNGLQIDSQSTGDGVENGKVAETPANARGARKASPRAARLAREKGVPLDLIRGTGPGGRIMEQDVLAHLHSQNVSLPSRLQKIAGERMSFSFANVPHFYLKIEVDASRLVEWRSRLLPIVQRSSGVHLTFTDLLVLLVARSLKSHPLANASWEDGHIHTFDEINVGLAVAVEDGLIVPVLKHVDRMTVEEIAQGRQALVEKATAGTLGLDELEGGTFTMTNLGMLGIDEFAAIINPPQSAILAVGRIAERVRAEAGQVVIKPSVHLVLSVDHRVLNGADGARFLSDLKRAIENPDNIFEASTCSNSPDKAGC